jgi:hypothetical protein
MYLVGDAASAWIDRAREADPAIQYHDFPPLDAAAIALAAAKGFAKIDVEPLYVRPPDARVPAISPAARDAHGERS